MYSSGKLFLYRSTFYDKIINELFLCSSYCLGNLELGQPRHIFKADGNAWVPQIEDQLILGPSHVFEYIKSDTYKL